jgi:uncharacterized spore protein YtfJ
VEPKEVFRSIRETLSARQVFGETVERDGVTVIPAATVIGTGGGGGGTREPRKQDGEADQRAVGAGMGLGMIAWPSGAFEIRDDRVRWRATVDISRIAFAALGVVLALGIGAVAARRRS